MSDWTEKIKELEDFFNSIQLPGTIKLSEYENITDPKLFVSSHLQMIKAQNGNKTFIPYAMRLNKLKEFLTKNQNNGNQKKEVKNK